MNFVVVAAEGDVACLIHLLDSHGHPRAATAVEAITSDPENAWAMFAYGGIRALIRRALEEEGAILVLVDLLDSSGQGGGRSSSENTTHCLWLMASSGEDFRQAIVHEGGLQRLLQLLQEAPNPETIKHTFHAIYALSASALTARALSSSPSAAGFLPQLAELIRQGGSTGLQHISAFLICNLLFYYFGWNDPYMWSWLERTDIPDQENSNDCGVFAMAFAVCTDCPLNSISLLSHTFEAKSL